VRLFTLLACLFAISFEVPALAADPEVKAEFGKGVSFRRKDDAFSLTIRARMQTRFTHVEPVPDGEGASTDFMIRRLRFVLAGDAFQKKLSYYFQLGLSTLDVDPDAPSAVRDAYATWHLHRDLGLRFGQMKVPFDRQRNVSSSALQFADRSVVTGELNMERDVGVMFLSRDLFGLGGYLAYNLGVFGGDGRNRISGRSGLLAIARTEILPLGTFDDAYVEADIARSPRPRLAFAVSAAYNRDTDRPRSTIGRPFEGGVDYAHLGVDWMFKWNGLSIIGALLHRDSRTEGHEIVSGGQTIREHTRSARGYFFQAGQMLTTRLEVAGRYGVLLPLRPTDPSLGRLRELGGAVSWYFLEHALKIQADYFYLFDAWRTGLHQVRVQAQVYF
jgi:hypothetical protein